MKANEQLQQQRQANEGRSKLKETVPGLVQRVIALQGKTYPGSGFHWSLMKTAGSLMRSVFNHDERYALETMMIDEVLYEDLLDSVETAEAAIVQVTT